MAEANKRSRNWLVAGAVTVLILGALGTVGAVQAQNHFKDMRGGMGFSGPMADVMIDQALKAVDATSEQRAGIEAIVGVAGAEIGAMVEGHDETKKQFAVLLAAETIDREAVEILRQEMLEKADRVSSKAIGSFLDAAELLTPVQRAKLIEQSNSFGHGARPGRN